jgi:hypothetical protein
MKLLEKPEMAFAKMIQKYCNQKKIEYLGQWYSHAKEG